MDVLVGARESEVLLWELCRSVLLVLDLLRGGRLLLLALPLALRGKKLRSKSSRSSALWSFMMLSLWRTVRSQSES